MTKPRPSLLIKKDLNELSFHAADLFVKIANESITKHGSCSIALAGGSTPHRLYELLASEYRTAVSWNNVSFFFGDERNVPADSAESNYRMANETLLLPLGIDPRSVYRWRTEIARVERTAADYDATLSTYFHTRGRGLDLVLLGVGSDAHTASLFPHTDALHEVEKFAVANWVDTLHDYRLTVTFPVINNASNVMFLVSGVEKAKAVKNVIEGEFMPEEYPAQLVKPSSGNLYWLLDKPAASKLTNL